MPQLPPPIKLSIDELIKYIEVSADVKRESILHYANEMKLDIKSNMKKSFFKLSGGMKQKLLIAISLAQESSIIIFDEPKSKENSSHLDKTYFDDMGCLILWTKAEGKEPKSAMVFSKDTKQYIKAIDAHYTINERTPMGYGFTAYEKPKEGSIKFDEVKLRMLRGEHMANPKIRKQILGE